MLYGLFLFCVWFYIVGGFVGIGINHLNHKYAIPRKLRMLNYVGGVGITMMLSVILPRVIP